MLAGAAIVLALPVPASAATFTTNRGNTCEATPSGSFGGGTATYSLSVTNSSCDADVKFVRSLLYLSYESGSDSRHQSPLNHVHSMSHSASSPVEAHWDFSIVLRTTGRQPERFRRNTGPDYCRTVSTFATRDTVGCNLERNIG
jgi:hypothetical protein